MSSTTCSPRQRNAQLNSSPREHSAPLPHSHHRSHGSSCSHTQHAPTPTPTPTPTPYSIGPHVPLQGHKLSPCPALNALCNHGAYGMPRDGQDVEAGVLANALIHVFGLKTCFAYLLAYGTFAGIIGFSALIKGKPFTLDLNKLCAAPFAHWAAMVRVNPTQQGSQTDGRPSIFLVNGLMNCKETDDMHNMDLDTFAIWRNRREQCVPGMPKAHKYIAAGELALLLQVFGQKHDNYKISRRDVYNFLAHERLPDNWQSTDFKPPQSIGLCSTFHVGHHVRHAMSKVSYRNYIPYYVWAAVILSAILGPLFIMKSLH